MEERFPFKKPMNSVYRRAPASSRPPICKYNCTFRSVRRPRVLIFSSKEENVGKFKPGFKWFGKRTSQSQSNGEADSDTADSDALASQSWDVPEKAEEWEAETLDSRPNPLGLAIMVLVFVVSIVLTTTVFKAAGRWRQSRRHKHVPSTSVSQLKEERPSKEQASKKGLGETRKQSQVGSTEKTSSSKEQDKGKEQDTGKEQDENKRNVLAEGGGQQASQVAQKNFDESLPGPPVDLPNFEMQDGESKAGLVSPGQNQRHDMVYTPQAGWTNPSDTDLSDRGSRADKTGNKNSVSSNDTQGVSAAKEDSATDLSQDEEAHSTEQEREETSEDVDDESQDEADERYDSTSDADNAGTLGGRLPSHNKEHTADRQQTSEAERRLQEVAQELERRMESGEEAFWGPDEPAHARGLGPGSQSQGLAKAQPEELQLQNASEADLQQYSSTSLPALRSRAGVAGRASLAASEASQRAVAYSAAASQAASKATWHAQRALAASHVAQQAAASRAERVLKEAVERAESAAARAQEAEEQAAEAAAHSSAHEEVAASQAQVSSKAAEAPQQEEETSDESSESSSKVTQIKRRMQRLWTRSKQKALGLVYIIQHWCQSLGHKLMEWLSAFVAWCKSAAAQCRGAAIKLWVRVRGVFPTKAA